MGYTLYHTFKSDEREEINWLYQDLLSLITIDDWRNLLEIFKADPDLEWEANDYFHEWGRENWLPTIRGKADGRGFCKTARKIYDIAVLLTYCFDEYLSWTNESSWDYYWDTEKYVAWIIDSMRCIDVSWLKDNLWSYIEAELNSDDYKDEDINNICNKVISYCEENHEERDYERIAEWFTSWNTWNWNYRSLNYNQL